MAGKVRRHGRPEALSSTRKAAVQARGGACLIKTREQPHDGLSCHTETGYTSFAAIIRAFRPQPWHLAGVANRLCRSQIDRLPLSFRSSWHGLCGRMGRPDSRNHSRLRPDRHHSRQARCSKGYGYPALSRAERPVITKPWR